MNILSTGGTGKVSYFSERGLKIVMLVGGAIGLVVLYKALSGFVSNQNGRQEVQGASNELDRLNQSPATRQKMSPYQAEQTSNAMFTAMDGYGTNEDAIYVAFRQMKNNADFLAVSKAFGIRTISSGQWNVVNNMKGTLTQCLQDELDSDERKKVNEILKARNIRFRI
jgi:hypothetical protein